MRRIGHSGSGGAGLEGGASDLAGSASGTLGRRERDAGHEKAGHQKAGRDGADLGDGLRRDTHFGAFAFSGDGRERESAFHDKVRRALGEATRVEDFADERDRARLVATAGVEPAPTQAAIPQTPAPAQESGAGRADQATRIDALADRIDAAAKAEMRTGRPGAFALRIDLGAEGGDLGLASVTVSFSPDGLDIVLARDGSEASAAMLAAAQALADRLCQRFERRIVRVYEASTTEAEAPRDGMSEIAGLFRRPGAQS